LLGQSQFGPVRLVEEVESHKSLRVHDCDGLDDWAAFLREAETLIQLSHPCIAKVVGYSAAPPGRIAMEHEVGGSLQDVLHQIDEGKVPSFLDPTAVAKIICGIVLAMRLAHGRHILHGNLCPANIPLDAKHHPKLTGFRGTGIPDPGYQAPEAEAPAATTAVDVFAFAVMLFELTSKRPAFPRDASPEQVGVFIRGGQRPEIPEGVGPVVRRLITRGWAAEPALRPSFDGIFAELMDIQFVVVDGVRWMKVAEFVDNVEYAQT
jgi:serine/threonine protein kinase